MRFPAGLDKVNFYSHRHKLLGGLYRAAGETPRPTAILLHGVPGVEKNLDVAYALRDAGWNCLYFHYRGCWGSEGSYSFNGLKDDVAAATAWVLQQPSVDKNRLALVGNSLGGYLALAAGAADSRFRALVSLCPVVDPTRVSFHMGVFNEFADMVNGTTGPELKSQWETLPPIRTMVAQLAKRSILLVSGEQDSFFPPTHHRQLVELIPSISWRRLADGDHTFSLCRKQLVQTVVDWVAEKLGK